MKDFATVASPLHLLTRKDVTYDWDHTCHDVFAILQSHLCSAPILSYPHFTQPFHLYTDASQTALGYILGQIIDGKEHVLSYGGRELNTVEKKYSTTEREALAVIEGITYFRPYLTGTIFYVHTDQGCLSWLMKMKDPTGQLACLPLQLQQYQFDIIHRAGRLNGNADALSHHNIPPLCPDPLPPCTIHAPSVSAIQFTTPRS